MCLSHLLLVISLESYGFVTCSPWVKTLTCLFPPAIWPIPLHVPVFSELNLCPRVDFGMPVLEKIASRVHLFWPFSSLIHFPQLECFLQHICIILLVIAVLVTLGLNSADLVFNVLCDLHFRGHSSDKMAKVSLEITVFLLGGVDLPLSHLISLVCL